MTSVRAPASKIPNFVLLFSVFKKKKKKGKIKGKLGEKKNDFRASSKIRKKKRRLFTDFFFLLF